jgi:hypothetical protein
VNYDDLHKALTNLIPLTHQEVYAILRHCQAENQLNSISMKAFWKLLGGA